MTATQLAELPQHAFERHQARQCTARSPRARSVLSVTQVADLLGVHRETVLKMIDRRELPAVRVGKLWRVAPEDVWPFVPPGIRARWPDGPWRDTPPT